MWLLWSSTVFTKIRLGFLFSTHLVFNTLYTGNRLLGYNMSWHVSLYFRDSSITHGICMSWHGSTSGSVDFQGGFLSKMFQIIRTFLQNCLIIFIVSHKALETLPVAAPAMLEFATKLCDLICSVWGIQCILTSCSYCFYIISNILHCYSYGGIDICSIFSLFMFGGF